MDPDARPDALDDLRERLRATREAAERLAEDGIRARVVSMPSWELFAAQDEAYQESVLPRDVPKVSVEAGISQGWERWVDRSVSIERFGASAPGTEVLRRLGITAENVQATRNFSLHTTGWAFDISRHYRSRAQALAFQFMLDRLTALNMIAWVREPDAIHVTVAAP